MLRLIVLPALVFTLMALIPGTAQTDAPLNCQGCANFYLENPIWRGPVSGDINGTIEWSNVGTGKRGDQDPGKTIPFAEEWVIKDGSGNMILTGTDEGVVSPNSEYRMNGVVTGAAPQWSHLIGRQMHGRGTITWDPETGLPLTASGTIRID